ncbi:MAG TPA: histidine kinase [Mucilaginibacter sp.]|nr:histidine kinase [Mucilaginibacter sp.]
MKVRWREHEAALITIIAAIFISRYVWEMIRLSAQQIEAQYAAPFANAHLSFNYYTRILFPQIGSVLILLLAYFWINKLIALCLSPAGRKSVFIFLGAILQVIILLYMIGPGLNFLSFYTNPYYRTDNILFTYPLMFGYHPQPFKNNFGGLSEAVFLLAAYVIYSGFREVVIHYMKKNETRRHYRVMIINQVTFAAIVFFIIPIFCSVFNLVKNDAYYNFYFAFVPAVQLVFNTNVYLLFPKKGERSFFNWQFLGPLLFLTFIYTLLFSIFLHDQWSFAVFMGLWAAQILIITPISWLDFQQRKEKILQLRGIEEKLAHSKADLQFLRMQINPHFLFNALNTLYGTALIEGSKNTAEGIQKLGDMMRFMLHENTLDYIGMDKEIEYLKNYISLQKLRTQTSPYIVIEEDIAEEGCGHRIAPMLLIPFVENAFKHGVSLTEKSWIKIKLKCDDQNINFEVRNSVHPSAGYDPEREQSGIGLQNVKERLLLLYPGKHLFTYGADGNEFVAGLTVQVG